MRVFVNAREAMAVSPGFRLSRERTSRISSLNLGTDGDRWGPLPTGTLSYYRVDLLDSFTYQEPVLGFDLDLENTNNALARRTPLSWK